MPAQTKTLARLDITSITGKDRNGIKELLATLFLDALRLEITQDENGELYCQEWRNAAKRLYAKDTAS